MWGSRSEPPTQHTYETQTRTPPGPDLLGRPHRSGRSQARRPEGRRPRQEGRRQGRQGRQEAGPPEARVRRRRALF